jgi:hypothetical protein
MMKVSNRTSICVLLLLVGGVTSSLYGESRRNVIAVDPVPVLFNAVGIEFERVVQPDRGIALRFAGTPFGPGEFSDTKFELFMIGLEQKRYIGSDPPKGGWIGIGLAYGVGDYWEKDGSARAEKLRGIAIRIALGHKFLVRGFVFDPMVSYQVPIELSTAAEKGDVDTPFLGGFIVGFSLGFAWTF